MVVCTQILSDTKRKKLSFIIDYLTTLLYLHCPLSDLVVPFCQSLSCLPHDDSIVNMIAVMMLDQAHQSNTGLLLCLFVLSSLIFPF